MTPLPTPPPGSPTWYWLIAIATLAALNVYLAWRQYRPAQTTADAAALTAGGSVAEAIQRAAAGLVEDLREELQRLQDKVDDLEAEINQLKKDNRALAHELDVVRAERDRALDDARRAREALEPVRDERDRARQERDEWKAAAKQLGWKPVEGS